MKPVAPMAAIPHAISSGVPMKETDMTMRVVYMIRKIRLMARSRLQSYFKCVDQARHNRVQIERSCEHPQILIIGSKGTQEKLGAAGRANHQPLPERLVERGLLGVPPVS